MKKREIEQKIKTAADHAAPHQLDAILSACEAQKGTVIDMTEYRKNHKKRWIPAVAVAAALALVLMGGWFGLNLGRSSNPAAPGGNPTALAAITFDVNPSVELVVDTDEMVTDAVALNDDGATALGGMELVGTNLETATNALIGSFLTNGYLDELQNAILVSVENYGGDSTALETELSERVSTLLSNGGLEGAVLSQTISSSDDLTALAQQYGISSGKAALIQEIVAQDSTLTMDALAQLSITELALVAENRGLSVSTVSQTGAVSNDGCIDSSAALEAACQQAGISSADALNPSVELDGWEGSMIYEVEFCYAGTEYEYDLDAATGEVVNFKQDVCDHYQHMGNGTAGNNGNSGNNGNNGNAATGSNGGTGNGAVNGIGNAGTNTNNGSNTNNGTGNGYGANGNNNGTDIGSAAAESAALADAGIDAQAVQYIVSELDGDHYDVEFVVYDSASQTGTEYDYEIHRCTGAVLERDTEQFSGHHDDHHDFDD